jgi:DNA polymerase-1
MKVSFGIEVAGTIGDTKLSQYILHPQDSDHLKDMAWQYSGMGGYEKNLSVATQDAPLEELIPYGSKDANLTGHIYQIHKDEFSRNPILFDTYTNLFVPVQVVLSKMEYNGIRINPPRLNDSYLGAKSILDKAIKNIEEYPSVTKFIKNSKKEFNIDSDAQIREIMFGSNYEGLKPIKFTTKTKAPSTDKTVFEYFATKNALAALFQTYSKYTAVMKTINEIKENLTPDNRIHTSYWITSTFSGRSSSSNPNLQNIPKGDNDPVLIRKVFIADPNYLLCEFDFNQHELRCMAEEADDDAMRQACKSGDVHRATAANLLGIRPEQVTDEQRRNIGKVFNFGLIYGMTVYGISKKMKLIDKYMAKDKSLTWKQAKFLAEKEAQTLLDKFFDVYYKIKQWMDSTTQFVVDNRYITMKSGLIKYFPSDIKLTDHELRSAINIPIQGLAGHILFYALIGVDEFVTRKKLLSKLLLEVHDSIVMGIHKDELEVIPEIKYVMCNYFKKFMDFKTPLKVDAKIGENWKEMEDI